MDRQTLQVECHDKRRKEQADAAGRQAQVGCNVVAMVTHFIT